MNESMSATIAVAKSPSAAATTARSNFYRVIAIAIGLTVLVGFARTFYLRFMFEQVRPMDAVMWIHGITFTAWVALFIVQTRLIAAHDYRGHMRLGIAGLFLAAVVVVFGLATAVESASAPRTRAMGMPSHQFVFLPVFITIAFSVLVTAAVWLRKRADLHKRLMVLAMISVLGPPTARILRLIWTNGDHFLAFQTGTTAAFVAWCLANDWFRHRTLHPVYAIGGPLLVLSWPFRVWFAQTPAWSAVGRWMASLSSGGGY
jgi:hypothetical protein